MRKRIMALFYMLVSVLILLQLGTRLKQMHYVQASAKPLYLVSQTSASAATTQQEGQAIDYSKWSHQYDDQQQ